MNDADRGLAARGSGRPCRAPAVRRGTAAGQLAGTYPEFSGTAWRGSRRDGSHQDCRALAMPAAQALISAQFRKSPSAARMAEATGPVGEADGLPDKPAGKDT